MNVQNSNKDDILKLAILTPKKLEKRSKRAKCIQCLRTPAVVKNCLLFAEETSIGNIAKLSSRTDTDSNDNILSKVEINPNDDKVTTKANKHKRYTVWY